MSRLLLFVPGLIWPAHWIQRPSQDLPLVALARLLGRGQRRFAPPASQESALARLFGIGDGGEDGVGDSPSPPFATLRRLGEEDAGRDDEGEGHWLCADPVNLSFMGGHVLLGDFVGNEIAPGEAAALIAALNRDFGNLGRFSAVTPTRWYLRLEREVCGTRFFPLHDAVGRPIQHFLPTGDERDAGHWRHVLNEIQVALHNHPDNAAREAEGRRTVNSLWFWGEGARVGTVARAPCPAVQAFEPVARGLARAAGIEPGLPDVVSALRADTLVVLDALATPARHHDLAAWRTAIAMLESEWFAPIARALDTGALCRFELLAPGDRAGFSLSTSRRARWYFWRKPLLLDDLCASIKLVPAETEA
ncbi:MAG: hypothetical protein LBU45_01465 [Azoarcus sp.]|jgi:hypothetical protein|nr:hypothetical protein [Azoarcus sp.]